ncbi:MAG: hypothetical protein CM1200mP33_5760 [Chloroflexota bacterium]|nr:MAG: hypothetical protein CM1200mP33_5760 [Chloroflexota bacterium]
MSAGVYIFPDTAKKKPQEGKVVAVGPGKIADDGKRIPTEVSFGDVVVIQNMPALNIKLVLLSI